MATRADFARKLAALDLTHIDRAIAFLWYYLHTQEFEERSPSELATDLHDEDFPKPKVSRLADELRKSKFTVRGKRDGTYQIDLRKRADLDKKYLPLIGRTETPVSDSVLEVASFTGTRPYIERLVRQINGTYDQGWFDGCAVLCRRLMESLIIEIYISKSRHHEIQSNNVFFPLERLISTLKADTTFPLGRNSPKTMDEVKSAGDTAAHDRVYITKQVDIDDLKQKYRRLISELMNHAGLAT
jgi:hypothetical protein